MNKIHKICKNNNIKERRILTNIFTLFMKKRCICPVCLNRKTVIVTGGCSGIGYATAEILASRGARVIIADKQKLKETQDKIICTTHNENVCAMYLDLASLESVRKFVENVKISENKLDILINNAGVGGMLHDYTKDMLQIEMQINYFGPFLLTYLLTDLLRKSRPSKIIFVSSLLAYMNNLSIRNINTISPFPVKDFSFYSNSKLCNVIAAQGFAEKLQGHGVTCNSLHPGFVVTNMYQNMRGETSGFLWKKLIYFLLNIVAKSPEQGAQTLIHLAVSDRVQHITGKYFIECQAFRPPRKALDKAFCEAIWNVSEDFVGLKPHEKLKSSMDGNGVYCNH